MGPSLAVLRAAEAIVRRAIHPTPQIRWPLLGERCGCEVWVKHENHTPVGSFKVRGGIVYMERLRRTLPRGAGVIAATRGNHGQSVAFAARASGLRATIVVPQGNSRDKNRAILALGAALLERGRDFTAAYEFARRAARERRLALVPSFHPLLVRGVASYALEFLGAVPDLDAVYVPIGLGSGICGVIAARDALGLRTRVVGVVAANAPAYALSFAARRPVATRRADTLADGIACRRPDPEALRAILAGADRIVRVTEREILSAMGWYFADAHNVAEGAAAAALAALWRERDAMRGRKAGLVLSGGNVDAGLYRRALAAAGAGGR